MERYYLNPVFIGDLDPNESNFIKITIPVPNREVKLSHGEFISLIKAFKSKEYVKKNELTAIFSGTQIQYLLEQELIKKEPFDNAYAEGIQQWIDYGWHEALIFHLISNRVEYEDDDWDCNKTINMRNELINRYSDFLCTYLPLDNIYEVKLSNEVKKLSHVSFEKALLNRRSNQPWSKDKFTLDDLSEILYISLYKFREKRRVNAKILEDKDIESYHKLYEMSYVDSFYLYVISYDIEGLENGIYFYDILNHKLLLIKKGLFRNEVTEICIGQKLAGSGKVSIALAIDWLPYMIRYQHERAYRNLFIAAGQIMQRLLITFSGMNKSMFITSAIREEKVDKLMGLNNFEQAIVYFTTAG